MEISPNMDEENKTEEKEVKDAVPKDFGGVVDALHSKSKLSSLRTYQGDMAEYIKNKNESTLSIAVKEKKRKEKREKEEPSYVERVEVRENAGTKLTVILISLGLIVGALALGFYVYLTLIKNDPAPQVIETPLIPYNNVLISENTSKENFGSNLNRFSYGNGINVIRINDVNGNQVKKSEDFFNLLQISLPPGLARSLGDDYVVGAIKEEDSVNYFLIITVKDFAAAFSGMLEWESSLLQNMRFVFNNSGLEQSYFDASTLSWKDIIVKNKDIRAFMNEGNFALAAYTFLDKNTILITNNISAVNSIVSSYASRAVAR